MISFGGYKFSGSKFQFSNDLSIYNLPSNPQQPKSNLQVINKSTKPPPRAFHAMIVMDNGDIYIHGG